MNQFLSDIGGIFLDMNSTFMFGEDKFGPKQNYYETYRQLGGERLDEEFVNVAIEDCYTKMGVFYEDPNHHENFPSLGKYFSQISHITNDLPNDEIDLLVDLFAVHELGTIPALYTEFLTRLAELYPIGLIANIWAPKRRWIEVLKQSGVHNLFEVTIFSSDYSFIKPSPKIFREALTKFSVSDPGKIAFIGDSYIYDMQGALQQGFKTIWISDETESNKLMNSVDLVIPDLLRLEKTNKKFSSSHFYTRLYQNTLDQK